MGKHNMVARMACLDSPVKNAFRARWKDAFLSRSR